MAAEVESMMASYYSSAVVSVGNPVELNNIIKVPVVIAAEIEQQYHWSEIPWYILSDSDLDKEFYTVVKPISVIAAAVEGKGELPLIKNHIGHITSISEGNIFGYVRDMVVDYNSTPKCLKGTAYITKSKLTSEEYDVLVNDKKVVAVSVDGSATFSNGFPIGDLKPDLFQDYLEFDYLAVLFHDEGRCPSSICGLNHDKKYLSEKQQNFFKSNSTIPIKNQIVGFSDNVFQKKLKITKIDSVEKPINGKDIKDKSEVYKMSTEEKWITQITDLSKKNADYEQKLEDAKIKVDTLTNQIHDKDEEIVKLRDELKSIKDREEKSKKASMIKEVLEMTDHYSQEVLDKMCIKELEIRHSTLKEAAFKNNQAGFPKGTETTHNLKDNAFQFKLGHTLDEVKEGGK